MTLRRRDGWLRGHWAWLGTVLAAAPNGPTLPSQEVECAANGIAGSVWGTGTFTSDSSICTAAVLEGLITLRQGGRVVVDVVAGEDAYVGSEANGITSQDYPAYSLSFEFPEDQPDS